MEASGPAEPPQDCAGSWPPQPPALELPAPQRPALPALPQALPSPQPADASLWLAEPQPCPPCPPGLPSRQLPMSLMLACSSAPDSCTPDSLSCSHQGGQSTVTPSATPARAPRGSGRQACCSDGMEVPMQVVPNSWLPYIALKSSCSSASYCSDGAWLDPCSQSLAERCATSACPFLALPSSCASFDGRFWSRCCCCPGPGFCRGFSPWAPGFWLSAAVLRSSSLSSVLGVSSSGT
mmetsp:Transcript_49447/g.152897  ORF Transcript_49447/g.152897 Transcript_49447/m.152897 type:complete len:237 (-) Transcript_49447:99-809(-)